MATFVVELRYRVDREQRQSVHPAHADYLYRLTERGVLLAAGPLVDSNGGLLVYEVADDAELRSVLADEPYVRAGFVAESRISQWRPGKGGWITPSALDQPERLIQK